MKACLGFVLAAAAVAVAAPAAAEPRAWTLLGQRDIDAGADRHVFNVTDATPYGEVRICVLRQAVLFRQMEIRFRDGGSQNFELNTILPNDRCLGGINLGGVGREVSQVIVVYNAPGIGSRGVRLRLHGR